MRISVKITIYSLNNSWRTFNESDYLPGIYAKSGDCDLFTEAILIYIRNNLTVKGHFSRTSVITEISGSWQQVLHTYIFKGYIWSQGWDVMDGRKCNIISLIKVVGRIWKKLKHTPEKRKKKKTAEFEMWNVS